MQETLVQSLVGKIPWTRERLPTPEFWPGEFHGLYSPWSHKELDMTEWLSWTDEPYTMIKWDLSRGCKNVFNICKSISVIYHSNRLESKAIWSSQYMHKNLLAKINIPLWKNSPESGDKGNLTQHNKSHMTYPQQTSCSMEKSWKPFF